VLAVTEGSVLGCTNTNDSDVAIADGGPAAVSAMPLVGCDLTRAPSEALVEVHIVHPRRGDLVVDLIEPSGVAYRLRDADPSDSGADITEAFRVDLTTAGPVSGAVPGADQWRLRVQDITTGNTGIIDSWTLSL
jgi:subtilisin-like proprotein convertase family protein